MRTKPIVLTTNTQYVICIINEINVEIWINGCCDYYGLITGISDELLQVADGFYVKALCVVKTYENIFKSHE